MKAKEPYDIYAEKPGTNGPKKVASLIPVRGGWGVDYLVQVADLRHPIRRFYVRSLLYAVLIVINTLLNDGWREFMVLRQDDLSEYDESSQS